MTAAFFVVSGSMVMGQVVPVSAACWIIMAATWDGRLWAVWGGGGDVLVVSDGICNRDDRSNSLGWDSCSSTDKIIGCCGPWDNRIPANMVSGARDGGGSCTPL